MAIFRKGNPLRTLKGQQYSTFGGGSVLQKGLSLFGVSPKFASGSGYVVSASNVIPVGRKLYGIGAKETSGANPRVDGFKMDIDGTIQYSQVGNYQISSSPPSSRLPLKIIKGENEFYWMFRSSYFGKMGASNPTFYTDSAYKIFSTSLGGYTGVSDIYYDSVNQDLYASYNYGIAKFNKSLTSGVGMTSATPFTSTNLIKIGDYIYMIGYLSTGNNIIIQKFNTSLVLQATKQFNITKNDSYKRVTTDGTYLYFLQRNSSTVDYLLKIDNSLNIIAEKTITHGAEYAGSYPTYSRGLEWNGSNLVYCYKTSGGNVCFVVFDSELNKIKEVTSSIALGEEPQVYSLYYSSDEKLFTYSATQNVQSPLEINFYIFNQDITGEWVSTSTNCTITTTTTWSVSTNSITFSSATPVLTLKSTDANSSATSTSVTQYLRYTDSNKNLNNLI